MKHSEKCCWYRRNWPKQTCYVPGPNAPAANPLSSSATPPSTPPKYPSPPKGHAPLSLTASWRRSRPAPSETSCPSHSDRRFGCLSSQKYGPSAPPPYGSTKLSTSPAPPSTPSSSAPSPTKTGGRRDLPASSRSSDAHFFSSQTAHTPLSPPPPIPQSPHPYICIPMGQLLFHISHQSVPQLVILRTVLQIEILAEIGLFLVRNSWIYGIVLVSKR